MATPIIVKPTRPAEIIVGKGETAGSPIFVPSVGGGGRGSSLALEQYFGMLEALGLQPITEEEVISTCDSIWSDVEQGKDPTTNHVSRLMISAQVNKGDSALENLFPIPGTINVYSIDSDTINNTLSTIWETLK